MLWFSCAARRASTSSCWREYATRSCQKTSVGEESGHDAVKGSGEKTRVKADDDDDDGEGEKRNDFVATPGDDAGEAAMV